MKMLGRTKRPITCKYGARCCTQWHTPHKHMHARIKSAKRREQRMWKREN